MRDQLSMLGLLASLWLGVAPPTTNPASDPVALTLPSPVEGPAPADATRPRRTKGSGLVIASGVTHGLGSAILWTTAGTTGLLGLARPGGTMGVTLGMTVGGMATLQGVVLAGVGGRALAKNSRGKDHLAKPMLAGGGVLAGLGGAAVLGTALMWPTIRSRCPIGIGCNLAGIQLGGAALSVGVGMVSYGDVLRRRDPEHRRLSNKAQSPLVAGTGLLGVGYILSAAVGLAIWQDQPGDALARRTRDRLLIPVVGPWIHAAGPDAPLFMAMATGGLGALQIGGALALAAGVGIAKRERRRERGRVELSVAPSFDGVTVVGRF
ncbi:hypothetical protein [Enhygromyxa salina]|uniref:Uncharacterized protein n=1 Tax=Enhygromyxa salina TaxID=215803 RepID=A0A2S9YJ08_9BACT|nr:hypothetical protein [Enhygromyxa salina]PRQ05040.1 hypothetical protein ENSA7_48230 [Enhygromyxa salina]